MHSEPVSDQHNADHHQERQREHDQRRVLFDKPRQRISRDHHQPDRDHHCGNHDRHLIGHPHRSQDRIDRKHQIERDDLGDRSVETDLDDPLVLVEQFAAIAFLVHAMMDFVGGFPQQEQPARDQDKVAAGKGGVKGRLAVRARRANQPQIEQRLLQRHDPADQREQADPQTKCQNQSNPPRPRLLRSGQLARNDCDEDQIVDPQHQLERDQRE